MGINLAYSVNIRSSVTHFSVQFDSFRCELAKMCHDAPQVIKSMPGKIVVQQNWAFYNVFPFKRCVVSIAAARDVSLGVNSIVPVPCPLNGAVGGRFLRLGLAVARLCSSAGNVSNVLAISPPRNNPLFIVEIIDH